MTDLATEILRVVGGTGLAALLLQWLHRPSAGYGHALRELERFFLAYAVYFNHQFSPPLIEIRKPRDEDGGALGMCCGGRITLLAGRLLTVDDIADTMIHEMVHLYCFEKRIHDAEGAFHNQRFKELAERVGLACKPWNKKVGWGYTYLASLGVKRVEAIGLDKWALSVLRG